MLNIVKTLSSVTTKKRERLHILPSFASIIIKPVSLVVDTFFSPRILVAEVVVDDCVIYSSAQDFQ